VSHESLGGPHSLSRWITRTGTTATTPRGKTAGLRSDGTKSTKLTKHTKKPFELSSKDAAVGGARALRGWQE